MSERVIQLEFERTPLTEQHVRDAKHADDWPDGELHEVVLDPDEITIEGTPDGIRWFYDFLHHLKRAWRQEGEQWSAGAAEEMAEAVYAQVDEFPSERQRPKQVL